MWFAHDSFDQARVGIWTTSVVPGILSGVQNVEEVFKTIAKLVLFLEVRAGGEPV